MVHRILGTPNEEVWPSVNTLPDYKTAFPRWSRRDIAGIVSTLDEAGIDMLEVRRSSKFSAPHFIVLIFSFFFLLISAHPYV